MAEYRKKPVVIEADVYQPGMEDGFICPTAEEGYCNFNGCTGIIKRNLYVKKIPCVEFRLTT